MTQDLSARVLDLETRVRALEGLLQSSSPSAVKIKKQSAREFLTTKKATSEPLKVLVFGYFLEQHEGSQAFNVSDLDAIFRSAREAPPKNINDAVNKCVARGYLMEAREKKDSKKAWQLTSTGERFVEQEM
ncbi:hypothetical protein [Afipia sp. Root123D2]|uniref:hypothetical protein n=1 Tax=Afipia sp. Root123D2 TaxID=1736436 RepID=UPI000AB75EC5|nr:hypothetical protein [Afipia sp. Root123D2]